RDERPLALRYGYGINAAFGEDAVRVPEGPLALPGVYQVKLTVGDQSFTAPLEVKQDPRVKVAPLLLSQQLELDLKIVDSMKQSYTAVQQIRDLRVHLKELQTKLKDDAGAKAVLDAVNALDQKAANLIAVDLQYPPVGIVSLASLNGALSSLFQLVEGSDSPPTAQAADAFATYRRLLNQ